MAETIKVLGRVPQARGSYDASNLYYRDNLVYYKNCTYQCIVQGPINTVPDEDPVGWKLFAGVPFSVELNEIKDLQDQVKASDDKAEEAKNKAEFSSQLSIESGVLRFDGFENPQQISTSSTSITGGRVVYSSQYKIFLYKLLSNYYLLFPNSNLYNSSNGIYKNKLYIYGTTIYSYSPTTQLLTEINGTIPVNNSCILRFGTIDSVTVPTIMPNIVNGVSATDIIFFDQLDIFAPYSDQSMGQIPDKWEAYSGSYHEYNDISTNKASNKFYLDAENNLYIRGYLENGSGGPYRGLVRFGASTGESGDIHQILLNYLTKDEAQRTYLSINDSEVLTDFGYYD